jgi:MFS family permease
MDVARRSFPLPASSYRTVLTNRHFLQLWASQFIGFSGQNAVNYALVVLVNRQTGSTLAGGLISILFSLPAIVLGPLPGIVVDRVGRWSVLWVSNALRLLLMLGTGLGLLLAFGGGTASDERLGVVALIYTFSLALSCTIRFSVPAEATAIPRLVGLSGLTYGLALFGITFVVGQALGLIVLGPLFHALFDWPSVFFFGAATFAAAALLTILLPRRRLSAYQFWQEAAGADDQERSHSASASGNAGATGPAPAGRDAGATPHPDEARLLELAPEAKPQSLRQSLKLGWLAMVQEADVLTAVIRLSLAGVVMMLVGEVAPNFVVQSLRRPPEQISLVLAPAGLALLLGALVAPRLAAKLGRLPAAGLGVNGVAVAILLLALVRPFGDALGLPDGVVIALGIVGASLLGFMLNLISIPCQAVVQEGVRPALRGQVLAFQQSLFNLASVPVLLIIGVLADNVGIPWALVLLVVALLLAAHWSGRKQRPTPKPRLISGEIEVK